MSDDEEVKVYLDIPIPSLRTRTKEIRRSLEALATSPIGASVYMKPEWFEHLNQKYDHASHVATTGAQQWNRGWFTCRTDSVKGVQVWKTKEPVLKNAKKK